MALELPAKLELTPDGVLNSICNILSQLEFTKNVTEQVTNPFRLFWLPSNFDGLPYVSPSYDKCCGLKPAYRPF